MSNSIIPLVHQAVSTINIYCIYHQKITGHHESIRSMPRLSYHASQILTTHRKPSPSSPWKVGTLHRGLDDYRLVEREVRGFQLTSATLRWTDRRQRSQRSAVSPGVASREVIGTSVSAFGFTESLLVQAKFAWRVPETDLFDFGFGMFGVYLGIIFFGGHPFP